MKCCCNDKNKYSDELEYLLKLAREFTRLQGYSNKNFNNALEQINGAIQSIEQGLYNDDEIERIKREIDKWVKCYGEEYPCNYNSCECKEIQREIDCLSEKMRELENESLYYLKKAQESLAKSREIDKKVEKLNEQYLDCVHIEPYK